MARKSYATYVHHNEFNRGRHLLTDEFRKVLPKSVVGRENINVVKKLIMQECHVAYSEIEATSGIGSMSTYKILHEHSSEKNLFLLNPT